MINSTIVYMVKMKSVDIKKKIGLKLMMVKSVPCRRKVIFVTEFFEERENNSTHGRISKRKSLDHFRTFLE